MDYSKFTKEQLIAKLVEQQHLAQAVEAKDHEVAESIRACKAVEAELNKVGLINKNLLAKVEEQKHLAQAVEAKDIEINKAVSTRDEALAKIEELNTRIHVLEIANEQLRKGAEETKTVIDSFNKYIVFTRNLLRTMQGTLENTIELESALTQFGK